MQIFMFISAQWIGNRVWDRNPPSEYRVAADADVGVYDEKVCTTDEWWIRPDEQARRLCLRSPPGKVIWLLAGSHPGSAS
jgi:hypothetical protein